jgi:hypothetical protein
MRQAALSGRAREALLELPAVYPYRFFATAGGLID